MARRPILGLFEDANYAAEAGDALQAAGLAPTDYDFLTDTPYPEGAFGERHEGHRLYVFPLCGALVGLTIGIILTSMTQMAYPLVQAGKPILSVAADGRCHLREHHAHRNHIHHNRHSLRV